MQKNPQLNRPSKYRPPGGLYKVKHSKNGQCPSNYKAGLIDFEMQISLEHKPLWIQAPQKGPLMKNISSAAYFRNFKVYLLNLN